MIGFVGSHTSSEEDAPVRLRQPPAIPPRHIAEQHSSGPLNASMWGHIPQPFEGYASKCGPTPEEGYPKTAPIADIIKNWNPDAGKWTPSHMYESVCRFDYATDLDKAIAYRDAEVPFQLYNVPSMNAVARAWSDPAHLRRKLGATTKYKCEASNPGGEANFGANHFMYTNGRSSRNPPIKNVQLSWDDWLRKIDEAVNTSVLEPNSRFYFRFSASSPSDARSGWLFKELPFFQPKPNVPPQCPNSKLRRRRLHETAPPRRRPTRLDRMNHAGLLQGPARAARHPLPVRHGGHRGGGALGRL